MNEFHGDHPALDLMNTVAQGAELWHGDGEVLAWLQANGLAGAAATAPAGLLAAARALRETVRALVLARKEGKPANLGPLNAAMAQAQRRLELVVQPGGALQLEQRYAGDTAPRMLAPLAEQAAQLLATADFTLVRKCEDDACTLWFLDRTKSHRRRWCSMALCGNRHKVASFRQRQQDGRG